MQESTISDEVPKAVTDAFRWRRHPALRKHHANLHEVGEAPIAARQSRLAAVRGVQAARDGRIEAAAQWFAEAVMDRSIRLQEVPGFWDCTRGGMQAAVEAYEAAERFRDASALAAILRTRYRPRALTPMRSPTPASKRSGRCETSGGD